MHKYLIVAKIVKKVDENQKQKEKKIKKELNKKLKYIENLKYKISIYKEEKSYKIKISLKGLVYIKNLKNLVIKALESFVLIKIKTQFISTLER